MRCNSLCWMAMVLLLAVPAIADPIELPGIDADANAFLSELAKPFPAGGTDATRHADEVQAAAAGARNDWDGVARALERRAGQNTVSAALWLQLAQAELKRSPADPRRASLAAWQAYRNAGSNDEQSDAMVTLARALTALNRPGDATLAMQQAVAFTPGNPELMKMLVDANRGSGLLVQKITTTEDADPPRACIAFNVAPVRRNDFHVEDWVRLDPPVPGAAITREGDQVCVSDLPLARTTTAILRHGMPAEGGLTLHQDATAKLAMGNRSPTLAFDDRLFLLPHGQAPRIALTSSNVSSVKISIALFTERTLLPWTRNNTLGRSFGVYLAGELGRDSARVVWTGRSDIPRFATNALLHTVLPLPETSMRAPGLYAVAVEPDDGHPRYSAGAVQPVLQTDLAPTVWRGTDGLTVQLRAYSDAKPRAGVALRLMASNNDILAETTTGADGFARFAAPLLHGEGVMAPSAIQATLAGDFVSLDLNATAFDLSDRGVQGAPQPGVLDGYVWSDRGIYRPGETMQVMALLRDNGGAPVQRPAHLVVLRPNGAVFADSVVSPGGGGSLHLPVTLSNGAPAGIWTMELLAEAKQPPLAEAKFKVDAFIPDRMAVRMGQLPAQLTAGATQAIPVTARYLYGAPAAHLTGSAEIRLAFAPEPPAALAGYAVGLVDESFAPQALTVDLPATDDAGRTTLPINLAALPDTTHAVQADIDLQVDDPSGHATHIPSTVPVRPATPLIGVKALFDGGSVDAGAEARFAIAAIDPDGRHIGMPVQVRLVREKPDWRLVTANSLSSYEAVWRDEPLETHRLSVPADGVLNFSRKLDFGRYRLEVTQDGGLAATSVRFRSGWASADSPDVPDRADVSADRRFYAPGAVARLHVTAPFAGPATLLVLSDRVRSTRLVDVPAGGADFPVTIDPAWGPGAYVAVHVFRGVGSAASGGDRPDRAIGLTWLAIDPAARTLAVSFDTPQAVPPQQTSHVSLHTAPGAWVSLSVVDEGILSLTGFVSPDPRPHFFGRRSLGLDIRDDWGRLIAPAEGTAATLRQGGDESAGRRPNIPQQVVSLFFPPRQADAQGRLDVTLPFPDFDGQVRLMAVAWQDSRLGSASSDMFVRGPLVAEPLLPRFLAPGDTGRLAVLLQNLALPDGPVGVHVTVDGPLTLVGDADLHPVLAKGAQEVPELMLRAGQSGGVGHVTLKVTAPGGYHAIHSAALDVHTVRPPDSLVTSGQVPPGATVALAPPFDSFVAGSWQASAVFGAPVRYDTAAFVRALDAYPLLCLEQAASKGLPLTMLPDGVVAGADRATRLQGMVNLVLDRQRYDGTFGLWSASDDPEPWLTQYALEFLLRAKRAGAAVDDSAMNSALAVTGEAAQQDQKDSDENTALQAYRLYTLALAGQPRAGANRILFEQLDKLPSPLAKAQLGAALALGNDQPRAEQAFAAALDAPSRADWGYDYGTTTRDQAETAVLLKESGVLPDRLAALIGKLPGGNTRPDVLSTQELAWLAGASGVLGERNAVSRIGIADRVLPAAPIVTVALHGPQSARNLGDQAVWHSVSITGVPIRPAPAAASLMQVDRALYTLGGAKLDLAHLHQNTVFVLVLDGRAMDGQAHRTMLLQGLPAGWEIAGRLAGGAAPGLPWLKGLSDTVATPAADDRFQAVLDLTPDASAFHIAVRLRATTPGDYELPGALVADMYRPAIRARQAGSRVTVLPPR